MRLALIIIVSVLVVVGLAVALVALIGSRLPQQHSVSRSIVVHTSPESVYAVTRDFT